jgi:hypothetical protein
MSSLFISFDPRSTGDEELTALIRPDRKLDISVPAQKDHLHIQLPLSSIPIRTHRIEGEGDILQNTSIHQLIILYSKQS